MLSSPQAHRGRDRCRGGARLFGVDVVSERDLQSDVRRRPPRGFLAPFAIFHQRYSTNTAPSWERAQPFRMLCHNGELNTIQGNINRMRAREGRLGKINLLEEELLRPVIDTAGSDRAM